MLNLAAPCRSSTALWEPFSIKPCAGSVSDRSSLSLASMLPLFLLSVAVSASFNALLKRFCALCLRMA